MQLRGLEDSGLDCVRPIATAAGATAAPALALLGFVWFVNYEDCLTV